jgi:hypothetical protein
MTSGEPTATFTRDGKPAALKSLLFVLFFGPIAFFTGDTIASTLGTGVTVARVAGTVVPTAAVMILGYHFGGRGTVSFGGDGIDVRGQRVGYEDVAVAVRKGGLSNRLFGTATFELFVPGGTTRTMRYVRDPDAVEELLTEHLPTPRTQLDESSAAKADQAPEDGPERIETGRQFWAYWNGDDRLPETAVVTLDELKRVMDVSAVTVDRIDTVDMRDADGLSDIEKDDVTSSSSAHAHP